jgi:hypothetical protein
VASCEEADDVISVVAQLACAMGEGEECGRPHFIKCNCPRTRIADELGRSHCAETKFQAASEDLEALVVGGRRKQPAEYCAKVNRSAVDEVRPLGIRELWTASRGKNRMLSAFRVLEENLKKPQSFGEIGRQWLKCRLNDFRDNPRVLPLESIGATSRSFERWWGGFPVRVRRTAFQTLC